MKKSTIFSLIAYSIFIGGFLYCGDSVFAASEVPQYQQLENIPGAEGNKTFPEYVALIYNLGLWVIGLSAMFMLTVGGFMYLTSAGNTSSASSAKGVIKDSLIGLVLGLSAWLIVNTINPDLTTLNISGVSTGTSSTPTPGGDTPPAGVPSDSAQKAAEILLKSGKLVSNGSCRDASGKSVSPKSTITQVKNGESMTKCFHGCNKGGTCTGTVNPSATMLNINNAISNSYSITSVSGGSHANNSAHYSGKAMDIVPRSNVRSQWVKLRDEFISKGAAEHSKSGTFCEDEKGNLRDDCVGADHIHVIFPG